MVDAINDSTGRSWSTEHKLPAVRAPRSYDVGLRDAADGQGHPDRAARSRARPARRSRSATTSVALWEQAAEALPDEADHTEIARWLESV